MKRAAKKRNYVLMFIASALLLCAPASASSMSLESPKNRAEKKLNQAQNRVEQQAVGSVKRDMNYDALASNASDCLVGPNNQLLSDGEFNYQYDVEGNQILRTNIATGETTEFEYDHRNRLVKTTVKSSGGIITNESQFVFDVFGRRIAVINDADGAGPEAAVRESFVYDGDNVWADYNEAGQAVVRYLFGDGIDSNIARWRVGEGTAWYLTDHLGTVRAIANAAGMLINQTTYDSFGQVLTETNSLFGDRYKFTGRELNSGNNYYYRARNYNARQGRFSSSDPLRFAAGSANLFSYVGNSPSNFIDPTGNLAIGEYAVGVGAIALIFAVEQGCDDGNAAEEVTRRVGQQSNAEGRNETRNVRLAEVTIGIFGATAILLSAPAILTAVVVTVAAYPVYALAFELCNTPYNNPPL